MNSKFDQSDNLNFGELERKFQALEQRVEMLEAYIKKTYTSFANIREIEQNDIGIDSAAADDGQIESSIGEFGLAWLGNIVLFFGITFLVQYLQVKGYMLISPLLGYASVGGIFFLGYFLRNSNQYMAKIFDLNAYLLLFYVTLKLHFFTPSPILQSASVGLFLLLLIIGILLYLSIHKKSAVIFGLTLVLIAVTAVLSDSTHIMLLLMTLVSSISMVIVYRLGWIRMAYLAVFLVYITGLLWLLGNPLMGHKIQAINNHQYGFVYLMISAAIFSLIALIPKKDSYSTEGIIGLIVFNGLGFTFVMFMIGLSFFKDNYIILSGSIALFCIVYSILLQLKSEWKITAALYALFGFVTLSIAFYGMYKFPQAYFFLAFQSLLVVSMAIWFRSKFIIIMNSVLFIVLLLLYLFTPETSNGVNFSFSIVALTTARILNWKKERLTIKTEFIRNFYLIIAFLMVLITLYHLVPNQYITLSWTIAAVVYFVFSLLLKNVKYRYMALATMIAAAFYLFIVDLAKIELVFRVIALLFLAVISIGLSFYYSKRVIKKKEKQLE